MMPLLEDLTEEAVGKLTSAFNGENWQAMVRVLTAVSQRQAYDVNAIGELLLYSNASGDVLTAYAALLGVRRGGLTDVWLRRLLSANAVARRASGKESEIVSIIEIAAGNGTGKVFDLYPAGFSVEILTGVPLTSGYYSRILELVRRAKSAGVRLRFATQGRLNGSFGFQGNSQALGFGEGRLASLVS